MHDTPALKGEWHKITLSMHNKEQSEINEIIINLIVQDQLNNGNAFMQSIFFFFNYLYVFLISVCLCINPSNNSAHNSSSLSINVNELQTNAKHSETFFMKCDQIHNIKINAKIAYKIKNDYSGHSSSIKEQSIVVSVVEPFSMTSQYLSSCFKEINYCYEESKFIVLTCLNVKSPWPLLIENTYIEPVSFIKKY